MLRARPLRLRAHSARSPSRALLRRGAARAGGPYCHVGTYGSYPLQTKNCL